MHLRMLWDRYAMWGAQQDGDAAFEQRLDGVVREIGDRGKLIVPEAVTPFREPAPAPAPTPTVAPSPSPASVRVPTKSANRSSMMAVAPASSVPTAEAVAPSHPLLATSPYTLARSAPIETTLSMQESPSHMPGMTAMRPEVGQAPAPSTGAPAAVGVGASFAEIVSFMTSERKAMTSTVEKQRQAMEAWQRESDAKAEQLQTQIMELKLESMESKLEAKRREMELKLEAQRREMDTKVLETRLRATNVKALQLRLEALYVANLLEDDELIAIEDKLADAVATADTGDTNGTAWECVMQMVQLSESIVSEKMFSRQLRRKFV